MTFDRPTSTNDPPGQMNDEFVPATQAELTRFVVENARSRRRALFPVGGRTALHYGYPPLTPGIFLSTVKLCDTIDYPARDMTITVEAGIRMDRLMEMLGSEGQRLPVDIAQSQRATLGGAVATNTSGPRRFGYGTLRDYVIGVAAVDAQGRLFHAGGRVVKNVAGYDLCKLLVGSLGTLAVITGLTLKLRPLPESSTLLWTTWAEFDDIDLVLERLLTSQTRPVALEVLNAQAVKQVTAESRIDLPRALPVLCIGLEGRERETAWQAQTLEAELAPFGPQQVEHIRAEAAFAVWNALSEFPTCSDDPLTFRAILLPSTTLAFVQQATRMGVTLQAHAGDGIVVGHLPDDVVSVDKAAEMITPLQQMARRVRGNLVVLGCDDGWKSRLPVFGEPEPSWPLMHRLKASLDPHNLLNPGRFIDRTNK